MIDYTWIVLEMSAYTVVGDLQDVVFSVTWQMTGSWTNPDSVIFSASAIGITSLSIPSNPDGSFTPYADLTELQVLGWIQDILGPDIITCYEQNISNQIDKLAGPPVITPPLPWIPVPPEPTPVPPLPDPPIPVPPVPEE